MSAEDWLYPITIQAISVNHELNLVPLMDHVKHIDLPACASSGTAKIQIDIVAADTSQRILVLAECKNFITFQGVSECAEQLMLKTYLLKTYFSGKLGHTRYKTIDVDELADYRLIKYVSLGHQGKEYANAGTRSDDETKKRLDMYMAYMKNIGRCGTGILIFRNKDASPIVNRATPQMWKEVIP